MSILVEFAKHGEMYRFLLTFHVTQKDKYDQITNYFKGSSVLTCSTNEVVELTCSLPDGLSVHSSLYPRMGPFG